MAQAPRDENRTTTMLLESSTVSGSTITAKGDQSTGRLLVDSAGGGSGTVTSVSVVSANGFAGTVATATTTPAITLSTTITGILEGNGTAISAASTTGTGSVVLGTAPTFTTSITVTGGAVIDADGIDLVTGNDYEINGAAVLNATTLGSTVVASSLTSLGTLTTLTVDDITLNANAITSGGASSLTIVPNAGQSLVLDGVLDIDGAIMGYTGVFTVTGSLVVDTITIDAASITDSSGAISFGDENLTTTGTLASGALTVTGGGAIATGDLTIGTTSANDVRPALKIIGDADSDAGGDTDDTLQLVLTPNADPTLATWGFTSTQSAGYTFDKNITFAANDILLGTGTGDKASIILNDSALADESWSGITEKGTGGATIAVGDVCFLQTSDSRWELVDGILDGTDAGFKLKLGICVLATTDGAATEMLTDGLIASAAFPTFTVGAPVYLDDTAGNLVVAQPTTTNFAIRIVGYAKSATVLRFNPSNDYIVHV